METQVIHEKFLRCNGISTDTRRIQPESMFFAISGTRFNANTFAAEALEKGAAFVIIDHKDYLIDERTILVNDSLETLQNLAKLHRNYLGLPIIALTGSNGKTTTKELIYAVLSKKYHTRATTGNLNNHIGVPLTLLSFNSQTEIGIVEMGANHQKEIEFLCGIAQPDYGYITNFGKAHLEGFGGIEGVIKGKSEMYDYLFQNNKSVFVNLDDTLQRQKTEQMQVIGFGLEATGANVRIDNVSANPFVEVIFNGQQIKSHLIGLYNATNISAAITIGKHFNVPENDIKLAIEGYIPENNRSQLIARHSNEIILDAYNANPSSMKAALENFIGLNRPSKIAFLGDMFELGNESSEEHLNIIRLLSKKEIICYFVGHDFYMHRTDEPKRHFFETFEALAAHLKDMVIEHNTILIKGSRGMALERVVELL